LNARLADRRKHSWTASPRWSLDFGPLILEWEFADVYSRDIIGSKTREIVFLAACAALGATGADAVKLHVKAAIRAGVTREQVAKILLQVGFVVGLPAAVSAIGAVKAAFAEMDTSDTGMRAHE
jgi:4-carboxymuconolactone decarboxylase